MKMGIKIVIILITLLLIGIAYMLVTESINSQKEAEEIHKIMSTPINDTSNIDYNTSEDVLSGVKLFFKDYNALYGEDGINTGYLIDTITIDTISKVSDSEVEVSISCERIDSNGNEFDSKWSGTFIKQNGEWVDSGNFAQTYSYNKNTKEEVPI